MWISRKKLKKLDDSKAEGVSKAISDALRAVIEKYELPMEALVIFATVFGDSLSETAGEPLSDKDLELKLAALSIKASRVDSKRNKTSKKVVKKTAKKKA